MEILRWLVSVAFGLSAGFIIAGAVFAFINLLGVVPKLARKSGTERNIKVYEQFVMLGGIAGTVCSVWKFSQPFGSAAGNGMALVMGLFAGVFTGCLAMCLAEVLDVIPILSRRVKVQRGLAFYILCIAAGKLTGSLAYFIIGGFNG